MNYGFEKGVLGVVAAGHNATCHAAAMILKRGGNAFDAVVAGGFAGAVAEPSLTSLGGGGFALTRTAEGDATLFDFFANNPGHGLKRKIKKRQFAPVTVHFPGSTQEFHVGLGSVAVPGCLKGLMHVQKKMGRLSLGEVMEPSIRLANDGIRLSAMQVDIIRLLWPILTITPEGTAVFSPTGKPPKEYEVLQNRPLGRFLENLAENPAEDFYQGRPAGNFIKSMEEGEGLVTESDLASYEVKERKPLTFSYHNHIVMTNPPPSFGGALIALALSEMERKELHPWGTAAHLAGLVEVMETVDDHRSQGYLDELVEEALAELDLARGSGDTITPRGRRSSTRGTTHISVADAEGNVASMTTSNGETSGHVIPGTGISLNNMLGEEDLHPDGFELGVPGERVASMMSPSIVISDDKFRLALGSGGSKRIRTALTQVISNVVDYDFLLPMAISAPRLHWDGAIVHAEPGYPPESLEELKSRWPVNEWQIHSLYFGGVHAVDSNGEGIGDPRRGGSGCIARDIP